MYLIFSFNTGGIERLLIDLSACMAGRGQHIYLCVINDDITESLLSRLSPEVTVLRLRRAAGSKFSPRTMKALSDAVGRYRIDILHCQGINCVLFSLTAKLFHPRLAILNTVHDSGNYSSYSGAKIFLANRLCSETIAISESVRTEILTRHMDPARVITIYNAINTHKFQYCDRPSRPPLRERDAIRVVNVARVFPKKKGQDVLLDAIALLAERYPALRCDFAGAAAKGQEEAFRSLQESVRSKHLEDRVHFLGSVDDIGAFLAAADIFVLPSRYEGFGIALVEALATGLPCIASDLEGPAEILSAPGLGLLFKAGDPQSLADCLDRMISGYESYDRRQISAYVRARYSIEEMTDRHLELYRRLLRGKSQEKQAPGHPM
jgi:glycosyltransferase involved in cell wall biosynthesis